MGSTPWPDATQNQLRALAGVPKLTCFMSILGSCYILFDISRLKRRNTYHRVILGMNIMDLLALFAWFFSTWPIPQGTPGVWHAVGNQQTCDAQGFFSQLSIATVLYNACLSLYFMLVIQHGWTEKRIQDSKLEYFVHFVCIGVGIGTAVASQILGLYNPAGWQCWMNSAPVGCTESWIIDHGYGTKEDPDYLECDRGDNANFYVWFFFYFPLWTCIIVASAALYQVYSAYRRQDEIAEKWRQKLLKSGKSSKKVVTNGVDALTTKVSEIAAAATNATKPKPRRRPPDHPTFTPSQKRHMRRQRSLNDMPRNINNNNNSPSAIAGYSHVRRQRSLNDISGSSRYSYASQYNNPDPSESTAGNPPYARSLSNSSSVMSYSHRSNQSNRSIGGSGRSAKQKLPPVLGGHVYTGKTHQSRFAALQQTVEKTMEKTVDSLRRNSRDSQRKKQVNAKTQMVTSQALLYLCSFYSAWFFQSVMRIQEMTSKEGIPYYHWVFLSAFFVPLQGLMNFIVYIRPKYLQIRREKRRRAAIEKQRREQMKKKKQMSSQPESTLGTIGAGSSSALLTTSSMADSNHRSAFDNSGHQARVVLPSIMQDLDESTTHTDSDVVAVWTEADLAAMKKLKSGNDANEGNESASLGHPGDGSTGNEAVDHLFDSLTFSEHRQRSFRKRQRPQLLRSNSSDSNLLSMRSLSGELRLADDDDDEIELIKKFHASVSYDSDGHVLLSPQQIELQREAQRRMRNRQAAKMRKQEQEDSESQASGRSGKSGKGRSGRSWLGKSIINRFRKSNSSASSDDTSSSNNQHQPYNVMDKGTMDSSSLSFPGPQNSDSFHTDGSLQSSASSFRTSGNASFQSLNTNTSFKTAGNASYQSVTSSFKTANNASFQSINASFKSVQAENQAQANDESPRRRVSFANSLLGVSIAEETGDDDSDDEFYNDESDTKKPKRKTVPAMPRIRRPTGSSLKHSNSMSVIRAPPKRGVRTVKSDPDEINSMRQSVSSTGGVRGSISEFMGVQSKSSDFYGPAAAAKAETPLQRSSEPTPGPSVRRQGSLDDSSSLGASGSAHFVMKRISDTLSRQEMMLRSKGNWISTKIGASKLVKGTVRGTFKQVRSIRNFAADFRDALKTVDVFDDWATALDGEDLLASSSDEEDNNKNENDDSAVSSSTRRRGGDENDGSYSAVSTSSRRRGGGDNDGSSVSASSRRRGGGDVEMPTSGNRRRPARFRGVSEEEKEEISAIVEEEHTESSRPEAEELSSSAKTGWFRNIA